MHIFAFLIQQQTSSNPALGLLPFVFIIAIFYFLVFMPMQRQKKQQAQMLASLEAGSEVVTTGGIVGTIVSLNADSVIIRVKPDNLKLQVTRSAVASLVAGDKVLAEKK